MAPPLPILDPDRYSQGDSYIIQAIEDASALNHADLLAGQAAAHADHLAHVAAMNANHAARTAQLTLHHAQLTAQLTLHHTQLLAQLAAFQLSMETRLDIIIQWLNDIFDKLEEIRVFHERYITERRLPRTSAASILMSELFGNENLDDDTDDAIYGKDFLIDPTDPEIPPMLGGTFNTVDDFGDPIFPAFNPDAPTKTWEEYLETIEEESYHS